MMIGLRRGRRGLMHRHRFPPLDFLGDYDKILTM
jgi:hypothetical protein